MQVLKGLFTATAIVAALQATAQTKPATTAATAHTWTNRISRIIPVRDSSYIAALYSTGDTCLALQLLTMAQGGKITAYKSYNSQLQDKLSVKEINQLTNWSDTVEIEDPVTGEKFTKVAVYKLKGNDIQQWRILEEWSFDESTGTLSGRIAGIAPLKAEYGAGGEFRGNVAPMWFRYSDVADIVYNYGKRHKDEAIFPVVAKNATKWSTSWPGLASFVWGLQITLGDTADRSQANIRSEVPYPTLAQYMAEQGLTGKQNVWMPQGNDLKQITPAELQQLLSKPDDTVLLTDPVTGKELKRVIKYDVDISDESHFMVRGLWTVSEKEGTFSLKIGAISPDLERNNTTKPQGPPRCVWIKYTDMQPILKLYASRDPNCNLPQAIWNAMFK